jgi:hypothetical protein
MNKKNQSRRKFLGTGGAALGAGWAALNMPTLLAAGEAAAANKKAVAAYKNITAEQADALAAFADQIIPPGDSPGAVDMGVVYFMDAAFGTFMAGAKPMIDGGLIEWDLKARTMNSAVERFSELSSADQTGFLKTEEDGPLFGMLYMLVLWGMFSDPKYGGNRGGEGWKLIGFDKQHAWQPPFGYYDAQAMGSTEYSGE